MRIETMKSIPAGDNPFCHDWYHQGVQVGDNVVVMFASNRDEKCRYLIIVDTDTGRRVKVTINNKEE